MKIEHENNSLLSTANVIGGRAYWLYLKEMHDGPFQECYPALKKYMVNVDLNKGKGTWSENGQEAVKTAIARTAERAESFGIPKEVQMERYVPAILQETLINNLSALQYYAMACWFDSGQPVVNVGHKLAASLLATSVSAETVKDLKLPFHAFQVRVPPGLLYTSEPQTGEPVPIETLLMAKLSTFDDGISYSFIGATNQSFSLWGTYNSPEEFITDIEHKSTEMFDYELDGMDERNSLLVRRLLVNVCLMMTDRSRYKAQGKKSHELYNKKRQRWEKEPVARHFTLTPKVSHDFREVVRAYAIGTGKRINVQSLVVGHWKNQPYGPKSSLRRRQFVEPYWRGPEDALIALRPHEL